MCFDRRHYPTYDEVGTIVNVTNDKTKEHEIMIVDNVERNFGTYMFRKLGKRNLYPGYANNGSCGIEFRRFA